MKRNALFLTLLIIPVLSKNDAAYEVLCELLDYDQEDSQNDYFNDMEDDD